MLDSKDLSFNIIPLTNIEADKTIKLKSEAFNDISAPSKLFNMVLKEKIMNEEYIVFGAYYKNKLIGGSFVTYIDLKGEPTLLIEYVFVKKEYQRQGVATRMLKYIFENKDIINKMFSKNFKKCIINPMRPDEKRLYNKLGFNSDEAVFMSRSL